jgi:outer membrane immunogenic protein
MSARAPASPSMGTSAAAGRCRLAAGPGAAVQFLPGRCGGEVAAADACGSGWGMQGVKVAKRSAMAGGFLMVLLSLGAGPAQAAPPPPPAPVPSWQGFYVGSHAGYGFGVAKTSQPLDTDFAGGHGFIGGLLAGYNYMVMPRTLIGIEGDASWSNIAHSDSVQDSLGDVFTLKIEQKQAYSLRARFGYLLAPETLLYGTAGWSWSQLNYALAFTGLGSETDSRWFNGPQIGGGVETMIAPGWTARLEYLHTFYNSVAFNAPIISTFTGGGLEVKPSLGVGRLALIYNFGPGAPSPWQAPAAMPSWNGVYIGGALGAGVANAKVQFTGTPPNSIDGVGIPGVFPTAMVGYDWRVAPRWVLGAEAEVAPGISTADFQIDWTAALRGRVGYLLTPATMIYGSAGWVTTGVRTTSIIMDLVTIPSQRVNAIEVGGGVETAITDHWLARFDYQYAFAAPLHDIGLDFGFLGSGTVDARAQFHYARLGLVYLLDMH